MESTIFTTKRLHTRPFTVNDLTEFYDMVGNTQVMQYIKKPLNLEEGKEELNRFINYYQDKKKFFHLWAVEEKESQELIGLCGVYKNEEEDYEIAYRFRTSFWGKGFGSEIAKGLLNHCFNELKIDKLVAYVIKENIGSVKILEKEMHFVSEFYSKKHLAVKLKYQITRGDWLRF